jgi:hypothetical protein
VASRPTVQLHSPNRSADLRTHLATVLPMVQTLPGVVGITLNGDLSRGYGDHLLEIDLTLYLTTTAVPNYPAVELRTGLSIEENLS